MTHADKITKKLEKINFKSTAAMREKILSEASQAMEQTIKASAHKPSVGRIIMKSKITKFAAAAIIIAVFAGIYQITGSIDGASVALADVAKKIERIQNCVFEKTTSVAGVDTHDSLVYYTKGAYREDIYDNEKVTNQVYLNYSEGIIVGIDHSMKLFDEKKLTADDIEMGTLISPENIASFILSKGDYKKLGRKMVDGVLLDGFEFHDKRTLLSMDKEKTQKITVRLWVDVTTVLPARIEVDAIYNNLQATVIQYNPKWDIELKPDFFEPKRPADYVKPQERGLIGINLENWPTLKVGPGMAAEKAGVKDGDVVLKINGTSIENIKSSSEAQNFLIGKAGEKVTITVKRGEQLITFEIVRESLSK